MVAVQPLPAHLAVVLSYISGLKFQVPASIILNSHSTYLNNHTTMGIYITTASIMSVLTRVHKSGPQIYIKLSLPIYKLDNLTIRITLYNQEL